MRSKEMSIIHEKTPNKYFYLQEQQKQTEKHIKPNKKNEIFKINSEILKEWRLYYKKPYSNQQTNTFSNSIEKEQNEQLTNLISKKELKQAILQMENEKSPGIDCIPVEFYKTFCDILENDFIQL